MGENMGKNSGGVNMGRTMIEKIMANHSDEKIISVKVENEGEGGGHGSGGGRDEGFIPGFEVILIVGSISSVVILYQSKRKKEGTEWE